MTCNFNYASLQIYRALDIRLHSLHALATLNHRLRDTAADAADELQGYATELLLTLRRNAELVADAYVRALETKSSAQPDQARLERLQRERKSEVVKQKSKSLQVNERGARQPLRRSDEHGPSVSGVCFLWGCIQGVYDKVAHFEYVNKI